MPDAKHMCNAIQVEQALVSMLCKVGVNKTLAEETWQAFRTCVGSREMSRLFPSAMRNNGSVLITINIFNM